MLILGVSGAIAALGDTLFRVSSVSAGFAQDAAAGAHPFIRLRIWHPAIAVVFAISVAALCYAVIARGISPRATRGAYLLAGLLCLQVMVGTVNLALLAPIPLQLIHLLVADLVWINLILLGAEVLLNTPPAVVPPSVPTPRTLALQLKRLLDAPFRFIQHY